MRDEIEPRLSPQTDEPTAGSDTRPVILIAEDEPDNQAILQTVVEALLGAEAVVVSNGREVFGAIVQRQPDVILLDLMMPLVDGFEVARRLRRDPKTADVPIVAISALARAGDREEALSAGCDDFIRKPFDLDTVERVIRARLDHGRSPQAADVPD